MIKGVLPKFGAQKSKAPTWREMLELRPMRNPALEWSEENERVVLHIRHEQKKSWKVRLVSLLVPIPDDRRIALDAIGTDVWRMLDGQNTVGKIARTLAKKYKLAPREAELSLQQFFKVLGRRGYVGFINDKSEVRSQTDE